MFLLLFDFSRIVSFGVHEEPLALLPMFGRRRRFSAT
jgi:hypothetical protein